MAGKSYSIHAEESIIRRIDEHAERMRRSRNFLIQEALDMLLEVYDRDYIESQDAKYRKAGKNHK